MPLYEYRCTACGKRIEVLQHIGEAYLTECPSCHGALERMLSAPALQFKGSGWYVTDYARGGGRKEERGETTGVASSEGGSASSSEAKPSTKPAKPAANQ